MNRPARGSVNRFEQFHGMDTVINKNVPFLYFLKLNNICHFKDHLTNLSRSFCKCCLSPSLLTLVNINFVVVSSTNFSMLLVIL